MQKVKDVKVPLTVGETYLVECLVSKKIGVTKKSRWPILSGHIGDVTGVDHWHMDQRFMSNSHLRFHEKSSYHNGIYSVSRHECDHTVEMPIECVRGFGDFFPPTKEPRFISLQKSLCGKKMKDERCPHMNMDLRQVPPIVINGKMCKVCPNHLITWDVENGTLIERQRKSS